MLECLECGKKFRQLISHVKVHNMTPAEYKNKYPGKLLSEWSEKSKKKLSSCRKKKIEEGKISIWCEGLSIENNEILKISRKKISNTIKSKFESGETKHWSATKSAEEVREIYQKSGEKSSKTKLTNYALGKTVSWRKGLTKETDERVKIAGEKTSQSLIKNESMVGSKNPMFGKSVLDIWIKKYGAEKALEMWKEKNENANVRRGKDHYAFGLTGELNSRHGISNFDIWKRKYGEKKAEELEKDRIRKSVYGHTLEAYIEKYGNIDGYKIYKERIINTVNCVKLKNIIKNAGFKIIEEFGIYDDNKRKWSFYDIYIESLNILIESDGCYWHVKDYYDGKKCWEDLTNREKNVIENDKHKNRLAELMGHKLIRIWEGEEEKIIDVINKQS